VDDDVDWDAFQKRAHHRTREIIKLRQHAMNESDDSLLDKSTLMPSVNNKPLWHVKCWVSFSVIIFKNRSHIYNF
jgi:transcription antitermination factor NusG